MVIIIIRFIRFKSRIQNRRTFIFIAYINKRVHRLLCHRNFVILRIIRFRNRTLYHIKLSLSVYKLCIHVCGESSLKIVIRNIVINFRFKFNPSCAFSECYKRFYSVRREAGTSFLAAVNYIFGNCPIKNYSVLSFKLTAVYKAYNRPFINSCIFLIKLRCLVFPRAAIFTGVLKISDIIVFPAGFLFSNLKRTV